MIEFEPNFGEISVDDSFIRYTTYEGRKQEAEQMTRIVGLG